MAGIVAAIVAVGVVAAGTISRAHDTSDARHWSDAPLDSDGASRHGQAISGLGRT